ncbi:MAG: hypothetical protein IK133_08185 [Clostridia bacterium]|nr:hypothetical protein [Clostridia bacterium]
MSSLHDRLRCALLRTLIALLLAAGIGLPFLFGIGQGFLLLRFLLITTAVILVCAVLSLRRRLFGIALVIAATVSGVLYALRRTGPVADAVLLFKDIVLLIQGQSVALMLHGDIAARFIACAAGLIAWLLTSPEDGVLPAFMAAVCVFYAVWLTGMRKGAPYLLPALPAILLLYAFTHHFETSDTEDPRQARLPLLVLPVAAVLLAVSMLLAPPEGTQSPMLAEFNETLRDRIEARFFFTQERARYTLAADGWMPQGEHRLGGRPDPLKYPLLEVETQETVYLRGAILDTYSGAAWYDSISAQRYYWNSMPQRERRNSLFQTTYPLSGTLSEKEVMVRFLSPGASTLFVPQRLRELTVDESILPYFNVASEVFITRNAAAGDSYTVRYVSVNATDTGMAALAAQNASVNDPAAAQAAEQYLSLPTHIQQEVFDLATEATAGCTTAWDEAVALRNYLQANYTYTLNVQTPPQDVDFVAWFLLAEKQGYCTYFASAMTVLCRAAGLPARYVEGYLVRPEAGGVTTVRGENAHAWTEVYLNGLGWVTFDPTPGHGDRDQSGSVQPSGGATPTPPPPEEMPSNAPSSTPSPQPSDTPSPQDGTQDETTPTPPPEPDQQEEPPTPPESKKTPPYSYLWLLLLILLCLLAARIRATAPLRRAAKAKRDHALLILWQAILEDAAALKLPMHAEETPLSFAARAESEMGLHLQDTATAVSALRYGRHLPDDHALAASRATLSVLDEQLSGFQKLILALRRAFTFKKII